MSKTKALTTWAEVAEYLKVSAATAKKYAKMGMPVCRPGGRVVWAFPDELDSWLRGRR